MKKIRFLLSKAQIIKFFNFITKRFSNIIYILDLNTGLKTFFLAKARKTMNYFLFFHSAVRHFISINFSIFEQILGRKL